MLPPMSMCYVIGIGGDCGVDCEVYKKGECSEPAGVELDLLGGDLSRGEIIKIFKEYHMALMKIPLKWQLIIIVALEAWEREPILLQRIIDKEDMPEEADGYDRM